MSSADPGCSPQPAFYSPADNVVLAELFNDINQVTRDPATNKGAASEEKSSLNHLDNINNPTHPDFQPTVFSTWDYNTKHVKWSDDFPTYVLQQYVTLARKIVRHETDVIFLNHIILYFITSLPSAIYLFYNFNIFHGFAHTIMTIWYSGAFTLMMHNHIHNNGVLSKQFRAFDWTFPYVLEPLMGHTWDSYYYHHVKAHHVEGNGPDDISSTIRYQRDSIWAFLHYEARFLFLCWFDLPMYFVKKAKYGLAFRAISSELGSYVFLFAMAKWQFKPALFTLLIPFGIMRIGLMLGNWGQHALVDEVDPNSDYRSSITLIDVPSNRFCFNDGYHTSHHLNPRRHWRDHPNAFIKGKNKYAAEGALVFHNIDYLEITYRVLTKNYEYLAGQLVPIGNQIGMSKAELVELLKKKTRKFTEEEIRQHFGKGS